MTWLPGEREALGKDASQTILERQTGHAVNTQNEDWMKEWLTARPATLFNSNTKRHGCKLNPSYLRKGPSPDPCTPIDRPLVAIENAALADVLGREPRGWLVR